MTRTNTAFESLPTLFPGTLVYTSRSEVTNGRTGERVVTTTPDRLLPLLTFLRDSSFFRCNALMDVTALDRPSRMTRTEVVYSLLSLPYATRLTVTVATEEELPSVTSLFPSAGWFEREVWDRYGVFFRGHPDLRRRLTDYGFKGHPLRKDFPLTGYVEIRYDDVTKRIVYEGVSLAQEYRLFTLTSPFSA